MPPPAPPAAVGVLSASVKLLARSINSLKQLRLGQRGGGGGSSAPASGAGAPPQDGDSIGAWATLCLRWKAERGSLMRR